VNLNPFGFLKYLPFIIPAAFFCFGIVPFVAMVFFLIQTRTFQWRVKFLYLATLALELPGVGIRFIISLLFIPLVVIPFILVIITPISLGVFLISLIRGDGWAAANLMSGTVAFSILPFIYLIVGIIWTFFASWGSLVTSFLDFLGWPSSLWITRISLNAYKPSERQREWYDQACNHIKARAVVPFTFPVNVYMLERTDNTIFTIANTMFISQALRTSENGVTLLAGELYWYNSGASRVVKSLRSLSIDIMYLLSKAVGALAPGNIALSIMGGGDATDRYLVNVIVWLMNFALSIAGGGVGVFLLLPFWQLYGRSETYKADAYAADLGYCIELKNYLDTQTRVPIMLPIPYFMSPEPFTELRHDKLNQRCSGTAMPSSTQTILQGLKHITQQLPPKPPQQPQP
jgi:hypothetical protein